MINKNYKTFLSESAAYGVFGASLKGQNMGNLILDNLRKSGFTAFGINPKAKDDNNIYKDIESLPETTQKAVIAVSGKYVQDVLRECIERKISDIWIQPGAVDEKELSGFPDEVNVYPGRCLLAHLQSAGFPHNLHRGLLKLFGKY
ncbi:MAG: hypothetical protein GF307_02955 [candidate division Zixibacteria bacterium]|nr:hypothetical protein [candidate division Zixibacteria bacterium]